jgi:hypothetical protein
MTFEELCSALEHVPGDVRVFDRDHSEVGAESAETADYVIWAHDEVVDIGGIERGRFRPVKTFQQREAAYAYILETTIQRAGVARQTDADRRSSEEITSAFTRSLLEGQARYPDADDRR